MISLRLCVKGDTCQAWDKVHDELNSSSIHPCFFLLWHVLIPTSYIHFPTKYANNYYYNTPWKGTAVNVILGGEINVQYWRTNIWDYKWYWHLLHPLLLGFAPGLPRNGGSPSSPPPFPSALSEARAKGLCCEDISQLEGGADAEAVAVEKKVSPLPKIYLCKLLASTYSVIG